MRATSADPHADGRVATGGAPLARAKLALVLLHGRGGSPEDMLALAEHLALPDVACLAPAAKGGSWWPQSFLAPLHTNEPALTSALGAVERVVQNLDQGGFGPERTALLGFSQGACLALEYAARAGHAFQAVAGLSGGLLGTGEADGPGREDLYGHAPKRFDYGGRLDGTHVFMGCHERDPHIPLARVRESAAVLQSLGAEVRTDIYPGGGHGVLEEEVQVLRGLLNR